MELKLPNLVVSRTDIQRLLREINYLDDFFLAAARRQAGTSISPPQPSQTLQQLASSNNYNLLDAKNRRQLADSLTQINKAAPHLHISFAADPSPKALETILVWLRTNIHPQVLLQVGLQPNITAGCVLRTPNRWFDFSLRSHLDQQRPYLVSLIAGAVSARR